MDDVVSLFNGISTFVGYLMSKPSVYKNSSDIFQPRSSGFKGLSPFPGVLL